MTINPIRVLHPMETDEILHNPGMGYLHIQRGFKKTRYPDLPADGWYFHPRLSNKITFDIPWSVVEPREGEFNWEHEDFEGCFNTWIKAGYKVILEIRGMGTRGTFYNDGVPQWVFDAGAKYIDEPGGKDMEHPRRFPVYWDPVFQEKASALIEAFGKRYNKNPNVEFIMPGHLGRWGEMHISDHTPIKPWMDAGFSAKSYFQALQWQTQTYKHAFPDVPLFQELGNPCYCESDESYRAPKLPLIKLREAVPYLVENGINLKQNGFGACWDKWDSEHYYDEYVVNYFDTYYPYAKISVEDVSSFWSKNQLEVLPNTHASYINRGGERQGLPELFIGDLQRDFTGLFEGNDPLTKQYYLKHTEQDLELRKNVLRGAARKVGYRLHPSEIRFEQQWKRGEETRVDSIWTNRGCVKPYDDFAILYSLRSESGEIVWETLLPPVLPTSTFSWDIGKKAVEHAFLTVPESVPSGKYELSMGMRVMKSGEIVKLPLCAPDEAYRYPLFEINLI